MVRLAPFGRPGWRKMGGLWAVTLPAIGGVEVTLHGWRGVSGADAAADAGAGGEAPGAEGEGCGAGRSDGAGSGAGPHRRAAPCDGDSRALSELQVWDVHGGAGLMARKSPRERGRKSA